MFSRVTIGSRREGEAARVSSNNGVYLVHLRGSNPLFDGGVGRTLTLNVTVCMPPGCMCFVQSYPSYPQPINAVHASSAAFLGDGRHAPLALTLRNTTTELQVVPFDEPVASLRFVDAVPVVVDLL